MKERNRLQVGDTVLWRGPLNEPQAQTARVSGIEKDADEFTHNGQDVDELAWKQVKRATVVFDNGHWDYGYNIRRLKVPKAWRAKVEAARTPIQL